MLHFSLDAIGASTLARIGFMSDDLGGDAVILWDDPADYRPVDAATFEIRRVAIVGTAAMELCVSRLGRVSRWGEYFELIADGIRCTARMFHSEGEGGPMTGFVAVVLLEYPVVIRSEWKVATDRRAEMLEMAASTRFVSPHDRHIEKSSLAHQSFRMSLSIPPDWSAQNSETSIVVAGPGSTWVLSRLARDNDLAEIEESQLGTTADFTLFDEIRVKMQMGVGTFRAIVHHSMEDFEVLGEGDDLAMLSQMTQSLRFHQFLDQS